MANDKRQLFEDCENIKIKTLKRHGYFDKGNIKGWYNLQLEIVVTTSDTEQEYVQIKDTRGTTIQTIELIRRRSNLNRGYFYLFMCPKIKKPCFKLYRPKGNKLFLSYRAYTDLVYQKQTVCPKSRHLFKLYEYNRQIDHLENELFKPKKKSHYKGKPTPTLKRLITIQAKATNLIEQNFLNNDRQETKEGLFNF